MIPLPINQRVLRKSKDYLILGSVLGVFYIAAATGPNLTGLFLSIHLNDEMIGFAMSLTLLFLPVQIIGAIIQQRFFHRKHFVVATVAVQYATTLLLALLVAFWTRIPTSLAIVFFLSIFGLHHCMINLSGPVYLAWVGDLIPERESNAFWNKRQAITLLGSLVAGIGVGKLVDVMGRESSMTYAIVLLGGGLIGYVSLWASTWPPDPNPYPVRQNSLKKMFLELLHDRNYLILTAFFTAFNMAGWITSSFLFVYLQDKSGMNFSMFTIQLFLAFSGLIGFLSAFVYSVVGNKYGRKPVLMLCGCLKILEFVLWGTVLQPQYGWIGALPVFFMGGVVNMGLTAAQFSLITSTGGKNQSFAIGVFFSIIGLTSALVASFSGFLYSFLQVHSGLIAEFSLKPFNVLALMTAAGYVLSMLILIPFRENGASSTVTVIKTLLSNNPFRSVYHAHVLSRPMSEKSRIDTLAAAGGKLISGELIQDLYNPSPRVRESAIANIARLTPPLDESIENELINMLEHPEYGLQVQAANTLAALQVVRAVPVLIAHCSDSEDTSVAQASVTACGVLGNIQALPVLERLLHSRRNSTLLPYVADALSKLGDYTHAVPVYDLLAVECNWLMRIQYMIAVSRLLAPQDAEKIYSSFERELKMPGLELEKEIMLILHHSGFNQTLFPGKITENVMTFYDESRYTSILEVFLFSISVRLGIVPETEKFSDHFPGKLFSGPASFRPPLLNAQDYIAVNLSLQLRLWASLKYESDDLDRYRMLTALLAMRSLLKSIEVISKLPPVALNSSL